MSNPDYSTMKELGTIFGTTSHKVGRKLREMGLRTRDGKPSPTAFRAGLCGQRWTHDHTNYCWAWHTEKVTKMIRENGFGEVTRVAPVAGGRSSPHSR